MMILESGLLFWGHHVYDFNTILHCNSKNYANSSMQLGARAHQSLLILGLSLGISGEFRMYSVWRCSDQVNSICYTVLTFC